MRSFVFAALGLLLMLVGCETDPSALQSHYATIQAHNVEATVRVAVKATLTNVARSATHTPTLATPTLVAPTTLAAPTTPAPVLPPGPAGSPTRTATGTPTLTPTSTPTFAPTNTATPSSPKLTLTLLGCNTGVDILQGLGEVTNAYVTLRNEGGVDLTDVCATLSASDEGKSHRDKTRCAGYLPSGFEVTQKLTVDTTYRNLTWITVVVTATQGIRETDTRRSCQEIAKPLLDDITRRIGAVRPFQR